MERGRLLSPPSGGLVNERGKGSMLDIFNPVDVVVLLGIFMGDGEDRGVSSSVGGAIGVKDSCVKKAELLGAPKSYF